MIAVKEGAHALTLVIDLVEKKNGVKLARLEVQPVEYVAHRVTVVDLNRAIAALEKWPETKSGRGVVTFVEAFNVALAFKGLLEAEPGANKAMSGVKQGYTRDFVVEA